MDTNVPGYQTDRTKKGAVLEEDSKLYQGAGAIVQWEGD